MLTLRQECWGICGHTVGSGIEAMRCLCSNFISPPQRGQPRDFMFSCSQGWGGGGILNPFPGHTEGYTQREIQSWHSAEAQSGREGRCLHREPRTSWSTVSATKRWRSEEAGWIRQWNWELPRGEHTGAWHGRSCKASATGGVEGMACQEGEQHGRRAQSVSGDMGPWCPPRQWWSPWHRVPMRTA